MNVKFSALFCFFGLFSVNLAYARWPAVDPHAENYYSQSPYAFTGNNPVNFVDPDGRDYYRSGNGAVIWQDNDQRKMTINDEVYENIGKSYSAQMPDGGYVNYYQDVAVSTSAKAVNAEQTVMNNPALSGALLRNGSPLSPNSQSGLMTDLVHQAQGDFLAGGVGLAAASLQTLGDAMAMTGYGASMTGLGAEAGVPLAAVGNALKYVGVGIETATDYMRGNNNRATYNLGANVAMYGIGNLEKFIPGQHRAIYNLLLTPYSWVLDYGARTLPANK